MTKQRATLEACLARFEWLEYQPHVRGKDDCYEDIIAEIRDALAEQDAEPVMWSHNLIPDNIIRHRPADIDRHPERWTALYTRPPRRKWQSLDGKEIERCFYVAEPYEWSADYKNRLYGAIEQKLKEKNHD